MNSVESNNQSLKYQRFTTSGSKDIGGLNISFCYKDSISLQKSKYLLRNLVNKPKMCKKKIAQIATNYTFLKSP